MFMFMHLADALIQSDLQMIYCYHTDIILLVHRHHFAWIKWKHNTTMTRWHFLVPIVLPQKPFLSFQCSCSHNYFSLHNFNVFNIVINHICLHEQAGMIMGGTVLYICSPTNQLFPIHAFNWWNGSCSQTECTIWAALTCMLCQFSLQCTRLFFSL